MATSDQRSIVPFKSNRARREGAVGVPQPQRAVVLFSQHHWLTPRRAGFHNLAAAYSRLGWDVTFVTVGLSPVSLLKREDRTQAFRPSHANRLLASVDGVRMYAWFTPFHPVNLRNALANRAVTPLYRSYSRMPIPGLSPMLAGSDLVLLETGAALLLVDRLRRSAPAARVVYRQSDVPAAVAAHPVISRYEQLAARSVDLVSVPDRSRLAGFPEGLPVVVHPHGVDRDGFAQATATPYRGEGVTRAVFAGVEGLDWHFVLTAAEQFPECEFHLIGPWQRPGLPGNVVAHGVVPFRQTLGYIRHADIGLHCIVVDHPEFRSMTPKVMQYTACGLPVVASSGAAADLRHVIPYEQGSAESIRTAIDRAVRFPRGEIPAKMVRDWAEVAQDIAASAGVFPPEASGQC